MKVRSKLKKFLMVTAFLSVSILASSCNIFDTLSSRQKKDEKKDDKLYLNKNGNPEDQDDQNKKPVVTPPVTFKPENPSKDPISENPQEPNSPEAPSAENNFNINTDIKNWDQKLSNVQLQSIYNNNPQLTRFNFTKAPENTKFSSNEEYLESIFKRTFSINFNYSTQTIAGTAWVLDYHYDKNNPKEITLYLATNFHVATNLRTANDYEFYVQNSPNLERVRSVDLRFAQDWRNPDTSYITKRYTGRNMPRNIFLAKNFMDQEVSSSYNDGGGYYADFSVIEWKFKISDFYSNSAFFINTVDPSLDLWVKKIESAAGEVKAAVDKNLGIDGGYLNTKAHEGYTSLDYTTIQSTYYSDLSKTITNEVRYPQTVNEILEFQKNVNNTFTNYIYAFRPEYWFFGGYPLIPNDGFVPTFNIDYDNLTNLGFNKNDYNPDFKIIYTLNNTKNTDQKISFNNEPTYAFYGTAYETFQKIKIHGGISGSLVLNEQGIPAGVLYGSFVNDTEKIARKDGSTLTLNNALMIPFAQQKDITYTTFDGQSHTIYAYNLVDGTDKAKFPHQIDSFREKLIEVYGPNYKTKLFPNGVGVFDGPSNHDINSEKFKG